MVRVNTFFIIAFSLDNTVLSNIHIVEYEIPKVQTDTEGIEHWRVVCVRPFPLVTN